MAALTAMQRNVVRQQQATIRAQASAQREAERARRAYERASAADEKEHKRLYAEARAAEVDAHNERLDQQVEGLGSLLAATLTVDDFLDFESLKEQSQIPAFAPGNLTIAEPPPLFQPPTPPAGLSKMFGKAKHANTPGTSANERRGSDERGQESNATSSSGSSTAISHLCTSQFLSVTTHERR